MVELKKVLSLAELGKKLSIGASGMEPKLIIAGVIALLLIGSEGGLYLRGNHYKFLYNADETKITQLNDKITSMTDKQSHQTVASGASVIKVIQGPKEIETVVKTIHDAPVPKDCGTPILPEEVKNAF
jgi:hypothetical protein